MTLEDPVVSVVDDDPSVRESLDDLFQSVGRAVRLHSTAREYLDVADPGRPGCLLTDVRLPGLGGLELQQRLRLSGFDLPVILMSGHADVEMAVRGMKAGAADFLLKPLRSQDVLDATDAAIGVDLKRRTAAAEVAVLQERLAAVSPREKEVLSYVLQGLTSRETARILDISEITVKIHGSSGMRKLAACNVQDLTRLDRLMSREISQPRTPSLSSRYPGETNGGPSRARGEGPRRRSA